MLDGEEKQQSQKDCIVDLGAELQLGQEVRPPEFPLPQSSTFLVVLAGWSRVPDQL